MPLSSHCRSSLRMYNLTRRRVSEVAATGCEEAMLSNDVVIPVMKNRKIHAKSLDAMWFKFCSNERVQMGVLGEENKPTVLTTA